MLAIAANNRIIVSDVLSGNVLQTLPYTNAYRVFISPDGSVLASTTFDGGAIGLWSTIRGTLLATLENISSVLAFSHTNRLYVALPSGGGSICDVLGEPDRPVIVPFPFPANLNRITLAPDDTQIAIQAEDNNQVWSLKDFRGTPVDSGPHSILDIDLSSDGSLLAISAQTEIEIWDVRIDRCRHVIQSESASSHRRPIAFSPSRELIASSSRDGIIVIDVQTGIIRPTIYSAGKGEDIAKIDLHNAVGISFDSSTLAALIGPRFSEMQIWDLPSGAHLRTLSSDMFPFNFRWSRIDLYLMYSCPWGRRYLNVKTFQEEVLSDPGDRFHDHDHLRRKGNMLHIRSPHRRKGPLFLALPPHLNFNTFRCHGDRVSVLSGDRRLLLLNISGLDAYMKEFCGE